MERRFGGGVGPAPPPPDAVPEEEITASQRSQLQQEMRLKSEAVLSALPSSWLSAQLHCLAFCFVFLLLFVFPFPC